MRFGTSLFPLRSQLILYSAQATIIGAEMDELLSSIFWMEGSSE
jgi:hypothetical protein